MHRDALDITIHFIAMIVRWRYVPGAGRTLGEAPKPTRGQFLVVPDPGVGRTEGQGFAGYLLQGSEGPPGGAWPEPSERGEALEEGSQRPLVLLCFFVCLF